MGVVRPAEPMPDSVFYRNGEADELLYVHEGEGLLDTELRAAPLRPGRLPRAPDRDDLAAGARRGEPTADALPRVPVGDRAAQALPQRLRPAPRALALLAARHPAAGRGPGPDRRGRLPGPRQDAQPADGLPLHAITRSTSSAGTATCGRTRSTSATSSRSPAVSTSRRRSTRRSRHGTSWSARSCRASSTTTRWPSRRRTTTRTSTATRSSTTSPATS